MKVSSAIRQSRLCLSKFCAFDESRIAAGEFTQPHAPTICCTILRRNGQLSEEDFHTINSAEPVSIDELIERWWADHFPGSPVARDTQVWNVAHAAKERLKRLLKGSN